MKYFKVEFTSEGPQTTLITEGLDAYKQYRGDERNPAVFSPGTVLVEVVGRNARAHNYVKAIKFKVFDLGTPLNMRAMFSVLTLSTAPEKPAIEVALYIGKTKELSEADKDFNRFFKNVFSFGAKNYMAMVDKIKKKYIKLPDIAPEGEERIDLMGDLGRQIRYMLTR